MSQPWTVLGIDLIGPLTTSASGMKYAITKTDLFTKWVIAKPLVNNSGPEVSNVIAHVLLEHGLVRKIITDRGGEFVNDLNKGIFETFGLRHAIASAYHPQTNGQDERTNHTVKNRLVKYCNENQDDWDVYLVSIVSAINMTYQRSSKFSPYYAMYGRDPILPAVLNMTEPLSEDFVVGNVEDTMEQRVTALAAVNLAILKNITVAKQKQKKEFETRKRKNVKSFHIEEGEEVLKADMRRIGRKGLHTSWAGPYRVLAISENGVATLADSSGVPLKQGTSVAQLKPFHRREVSETMGGTSEEDTLVVAGAACTVGLDHDYAAEPINDVPSIVNYINYARQWVCREKVRLKGNVSEPSFFNMEEEDRHNAIKAVQEEDDTSAKDPFLFIFEYKADHDTFLEECVDPQNLVVACGHDEEHSGAWDPE